MIFARRKKPRRSDAHVGSQSRDGGVAAGAKEGGGAGRGAGVTHGEFQEAARSHGGDSQGGDS
jgi:hypothetical protein